MTPGEKNRALILRLMGRIQLPMTSKEIADALHFETGIRLSVASVGSNLAYLRAAKNVDRRQCPVWGKPYWFKGAWRFQTENYWWHTTAVSKDKAMRFIRERRHFVEAQARDNQRMKGRPVTNRLTPWTDDMHQMVQDLKGTPA